MLKKLLVALPLVLFASAILFISILRVASVKYEYNGPMNPKKGFLSSLNSQVDYQLPDPGTVLPDSPLWALKVMRDRLWLFITTDPYRKAEMELLFADKRLGSAKILFEQNKPDIGMATLEKGERYLTESADLERVLRGNGSDTHELLDRLTRASLRHYEIMNLMYDSAPDEARPAIIVLEMYPKRVYENARNAQLDKGIVPYENPFHWK